MNAYQLLSEIYRLLGQMNETTLVDLAKMPISPDIKPIVDGMIRAMDKKEIPLEIKPTTQNSESQVTQVVSPRNEINFLSNMPSSLDVIEACKKLTTSEFVSVLKKAGISIPSNFKGSRRAIENKIMRELDGLSEKKRRSVVDTVGKQLGYGEIEGWFRAIRDASKV